MLNDIKHIMFSAALSGAAVFFYKFSLFETKVLEKPKISAKIIVSSKLHPRIKTYLVLECVDNQWYMSLPHYPYSVYTPSDEFLKILFDNRIIYP